MALLLAKFLRQMRAWNFSSSIEEIHLQILHKLKCHQLDEKQSFRFIWCHCCKKFKKELSMICKLRDNLQVQTIKVAPPCQKTVDYDCNLLFQPENQGTKGMVITSSYSQLCAANHTQLKTSPTLPFAVTFICNNGFQQRSHLERIDESFSCRQRLRSVL